MGMQYYYFAAKDDAAAIAAFQAPEPLPAPLVFMEEIRPDLLGDFEHALTGRSMQEVTADPRHLQQIATQYLKEDPNIEESGLLTVTDTFARALAEADPANLPGWYQELAEPTRDLAVVARHAVAHSHHLYCVWLE